MLGHILPSIIAYNSQRLINAEEAALVRFLLCAEGSKKIRSQ
jgi:hypothetical protein